MLRFLFVLFVSLFIFVSLNSVAQEELIRYDFSEDSAVANSITLMGAGFGEYSLPDVSFGDIPTENAFEGATDGQGIQISAIPGQGALFIFPTLSLKGPALIRCSVRTDNPLASITIGTIDQGERSFITTNTANDSYYFMDRYRRIAVFCVAGSKSILPVIQLINAGTSGVLTVYLDNFEIFPLDPDKFYSTQFLDGDDVDPIQISHVPPETTPTPVQSIPTPTPTINQIAPISTPTSSLIETKINEKTGRKEITIRIPGVSVQAKPLKMVLIPSGTFLMGSPAEEKGRYADEKQNTVTITRPYYIGKYEVTQALWEALMGDQWQDAMGENYTDSFGIGPDYPIYIVNWSDCQEFIRRINKLGLGTFRLPTEAEWEYACRAGTETRFYWGNDPFGTQANNHAWWWINSDPILSTQVIDNFFQQYESRIGDIIQYWDNELGKAKNDAIERGLSGSTVIISLENAYAREKNNALVQLEDDFIFEISYMKKDLNDKMLGKTHEVGKKNPNYWGLHDMSGNVWEWCSDWYASYPTGSKIDPTGPVSGTNRIVRGGCWYDLHWDCRSAARLGLSPDKRNFIFGFRLVRESEFPGQAVPSKTNTPTPTFTYTTTPTSTFTYTPTPTNTSTPTYVYPTPTPIPPTNTPTPSGEFNGETITIPLDLPNGTKPLEMVFIPAGTFEMGSNSGNDDEKPIHEVTISNDFYIGMYEVTQAQWQAVMGSNPAHAYGVGNDYPVYSVSWNDCQEFITKLNQMGQGTFELPTEAEWEYACRAGTTTDYYSNYNQIGDYAWYSGNNSPYGTKEVGTKLPNPRGLHDMSGNLWEWCKDWYSGYSSMPEIDPIVTNAGKYRVIRGGSWDNIARICRSAYRGSKYPNYSNDLIGFRLCRTP